MRIKHKQPKTKHVCVHRQSATTHSETNLTLATAGLIVTIWFPAQLLLDVV